MASVPPVPLGRPERVAAYTSRKALTFRSPASYTAKVGDRKRKEAVM